MKKLPGGWSVQGPDANEVKRFTTITFKFFEATEFPERVRQRDLLCFSVETVRWPMRIRYKRLLIQGCDINLIKAFQPN